MKKSFRAKRMERAHSRNQQAALNLTSLMDIFTILVFFLMVNSGDAVKIIDTDNLKMPVSKASAAPDENLVIQITSNDVVIQGRKVADLADIKPEMATLDSLDEELKYQATRMPALTTEEQELGRPITIQADSKLPYAILRLVMSTCAGAEFRDISLAVTQKAGES